MSEWWKLTNEEAERLNPPPLIVVLTDDGNEYILQVDYPDWQPVGHIPRPRTRPGWFVYHIIHGLYMRYPWWKVLGFALASNTMGPDIYVDLDEYLMRDRSGE